MENENIEISLMNFLNEQEVDNIVVEVIQEGNNSGKKTITAWGQWKPNLAAAERSAEREWDKKANQLKRKLEAQGYKVSFAYGGHHCISKEDKTKIRCKAHGDVVYTKGK